MSFHLLYNRRFLYVLYLTVSMSCNLACNSFVLKSVNPMPCKRRWDTRMPMLLLLIYKLLTSWECKTKLNSTLYCHTTPPRCHYSTTPQGLHNTPCSFHTITTSPKHISSASKHSCEGEALRRAEWCGSFASELSKVKCIFITFPSWCAVGFPLWLVGCTSSKGCLSWFSFV